LDSSHDGPPDEFALLEESVLINRPGEVQPLEESGLSASYQHSIAPQPTTQPPRKKDLLLAEGVLGLPGTPFTIPFRSAGASGPAGAVETEGENAGEGSVSRLLGSVKVISGKASSAIFHCPALS
jgi:hypothetical protein